MVASPTLRRSLLTALVLVGGSAVGLSGQSVARVRVEENVRREPNGEVLARMNPGAQLAVSGRRDRWLEVNMEGWVWARSLQSTDRDGFNLVVSEAQGENLRDAPSGEILGRLGRGTLLTEVERRPGWIRVRRQVWIWAESVVETSVASGEARAAEPEAPRAAPEPGPAARRPVGVITARSQGAALLAAPSGDTLARAVPGADLQVLSREGNWARVRLEGWTWLPQPAEEEGHEDVSPDAVTPADLMADPAAYRGRVISWRLQYISLERAEKVRTDFFEGEPFLLTRFGGADGPFVYVALPGDQAEELEGLVPLETLEVTGRVRTGASSLTGTPIIDLVTVERVREPQ